jgi:hypothetical protein
MSSHTPGPWRHYLNSASTADTHCVNVERVEWSDSHSIGIAYLQSYKADGYDDRDETLANARLIAVAPEMLEMLVHLAEALEDGHWQETKTAIRDLIAKARGDK